VSHNAIFVLKTAERKASRPYLKLLLNYEQSSRFLTKERSKFKKNALQFPWQRKRKIQAVGKSCSKTQNFFKNTRKSV
jgi:hypothetical protein